MRNGQISIFMIIGVLLLAAAGFIFLGTDKSGSEAKISSDSPIENFIEDCIEDTAGYGLYLLGIHGGRIYGLDDAFVKDNLKVTYAHVPLNESKSDLERYIDENLNSGAYSCIKDLRPFLNEYDKMDIGNVSSEVIFSDGGTMVKVNMSVILSKGNAMKKYESFEHRFDVRYRKVHDFIGDNLVFGEIPDAAVFSGDFEARLIPDAGENTDIYTLIDKKSRLNSKEYIFLTAVPTLERNSVCPS